MLGKCVKIFFYWTIHTKYKEAASKLWDKGKVSTLSNKNCLVRRTAMNQSALYFPDLGECFTYSERMRTTHQKFYTGLWSQTLRQKNAQEALPNLPLCASFWRRV